MKQIAVCMALLSLLAACSGLTRQGQLEPPPANLTTPCPEPELIAPGANMGDLLLADIALAGQYTECRRKHAGLVEWATKVTRH